MTKPLTRRHFLSIVASAVAAPAFAGTNTANWQGAALGSGATMRLESIDPAAASEVFAAVAAEIRRLEGVFSLYDARSSLSKLNREGRLRNPPAELLEVLGLADRLHAASCGCFDPTIQPLWVASAKCAAHVCSNVVSPALIMDRAGWGHVAFDTLRVEFSKPDMALTLNGVAQGYITDRVRAILLAKGMRDILIDIGEIAANGKRADGASWVAGVARPDGSVIRKVTLRNRALATSSPSGTVLDAEGKIGHIIDPRTGRTAERYKVASVSAETAAVADGLSTACCMLTRSEAAEAVAAFPSARLEVLS